MTGESVGSSPVARLESWSPVSQTEDNQGPSRIQEANHGWSLI